MPGSSVGMAAAGVAAGWGIQGAQFQGTLMGQWGVGDGRFPVYRSGCPSTFNVRANLVGWIVLEHLWIETQDRLQELPWGQQLEMV